MPGARPLSCATAAMVLAGALLFISETRSRADDTAADVQMADRYQQAAEKGDAAAQLHLGAIYSSGAGRPQSDREAFSWFSRAAEGGNAEAQLILSGLYAIGRGTARSNTDAYKWALVAAAGPNTAEDKNGALQYMGGIDSIATADPDDIAHAEPYLKEAMLAVAQGANDFWLWGVARQRDLSEWTEMGRARQGEQPSG